MAANSRSFEKNMVVRMSRMQMKMVLPMFISATQVLYHLRS